MKKKTSISIFRKQSIAVVPYVNIATRLERITIAMGELFQSLVLLAMAFERANVGFDDLSDSIKRKYHGTKKIAGN